ncbi:MULTISPECIES: alginate O-acetyltransferase AlgX-related protein [Methylosinus]|uniref:alginate O-acetyltransferase AlgX-related protein n=1 Tax=Methylosinus TaxID=425 RepID=UPI0001D2D4C5|nr:MULTISPECIES: alginate O-acetyltransferase AlgJ [Methylosinus]OBS53272.1 alginate O-acetyltransferase [Methylosinus sp. 3S-1]
MRQSLARLPIFAAAGAILFYFLSVFWNAAVERDHPKWRLRSAKPLAGVAEPAPLDISTRSFLSGALQKSASTALGRSLWVFPFSVRAKNQLLFSLFGVSGAQNIVIGRDGQLFERFYIDEFCSRGEAPDRSVVDRWADRVAADRAALHAMGKGFAYMISPSKASYAPHAFPERTHCPALAARTTDKLAPFRSALAARALPHVDAPALLAARRAAYPLGFFPRGGTHWNLLAAALATREATRQMATREGAFPLGRYDFDWSLSQEAKGTDQDLLELLNLLWPDTHYPVAKLAAKTATPCVRAPRLTALGGSFLREIIVALAYAPCPPEVDYWFSLRSETDHMGLVRYHTQPGETGNGERRDADLSQLRASLETADAVLLEENEAQIGALSQVDNLWRALHPGADAVASDGRGQPAAALARPAMRAYSP